ncbi:MAG: sulfite oxidase [Isosphaeraceae bacterium]|nr:sulfite oxidase [Isosphaeraceae bacterium]
MDHDRALFGRRDVLRASFAATLAGMTAGASRARGAEPRSAADGLIVRNRRPLDLETPVTELGSWLTPNDRFFVRSHFGPPAVGLAPWEVSFAGLLDHDRTFSLNDLHAHEVVTVPAVLQCAGNGRGFFRPTIPGVGWERGAVGHAEWSGVRLADLLKKLGVRAGAAHVHLLGADGPPSPRTPAWFRSIPLERALAPSTILATRMNGVPLPLLHGGPVRLIVPGWTGNHWVKWLRHVTVARDEAQGFYMQTGYRIPKLPVPPGAAVKPSDLVPVTTMNVKSLITTPAAGTRLARGEHEVRGIAWTGDGHVTRVEFSTDRDPAWKPAQFLDEARPGSWRRWRATWSAADRAPHTLRVRATDSNGESQPETTPWNRSGYLWNGIDAVTCEVV